MNYSAKTTITEETKKHVILAPIAADLEEIPGIGPKTAENLKADGVENQFQLYGKFLALRTSAMTPEEHCEAFRDYLKVRKSSSRHVGVGRRKDLQRVVRRTRPFPPPGFL